MARDRDHQAPAIVVEGDPDHAEKHQRGDPRGRRRRRPAAAGRRRRCRGSAARCGRSGGHRSQGAKRIMAVRATAMAMRRRRGRGSTSTIERHEREGEDERGLEEPHLPLRDTADEGMKRVATAQAARPVAEHHRFRPAVSAVSPASDLLESTSLLTSTADRCSQARGGHKGNLSACRWDGAKWKGIHMPGNQAGDRRNRGGGPDGVSYCWSRTMRCWPRLSPRF